MSKVDDTLVIPEVVDAPWVKRFFKRRLGIPVRVTNAGAMNFGGRGWAVVWIMSDRSQRDLVYHHEFPAELGNRCLRLTYPNSEQLCSQNWAGNVRSHDIGMDGAGWRLVLQGLLDNPIVVKDAVDT
jgi:hypothetical protein